jgi:hypothetical protein
MNAAQKASLFIVNEIWILLNCGSNQPTFKEAHLWQFAINLPPFSIPSLRRKHRKNKEYKSATAMPKHDVVFLPI